MLKRFIHPILSFSTTHAPLAVILTLAATAVLGYFATRVRINSDFGGLLPADAEVNRLIETYGGQAPHNELLVVAIQGPKLYCPETLETFSAVIDRIGALPGFSGVLSPFNLLSFRRSEAGRLEIGPLAEGGQAPENEEQLARFRERLSANRFARNLVVSPDGSLLAAFFQKPEQGGNVAIMEDVRTITAVLQQPGLSVHISGSIPLAERTNHYISRDILRLILLSAVLIMLFYYAGYRSARAVLLPLVVLSFGTLWAIGFMGIFGFDITLISIVAPPLIMIFGNEYSIYVIQEYYRLNGQRAAGRSSSNGPEDPGDVPRISQAVLRVTRPITMAFITTVIGYLSLCVTEIRQTQEFAIVASAGSLACGFLALFFLPALLTLLRPPAGRRRGKRSAKLFSKLLSRAGDLARRRPLRVLIVLPVIVAVFLFSIRFLTFNTDSVKYFPRKDRFIRDMYVLTGKIGGFDEIQVTYVAPDGRKNYFLDPSVLRELEAVERTLLDHPDVCYTISPASLLGAVNLALSGLEQVPENRALPRLFLPLIASVAAGSEGGSMVGNLTNEDLTRVTVKLRVYNSETGHFMDEYKFRKFLAYLRGTVDERPVGEATPVIWGNILRKLSLADTLRRFLIISMLISLASIVLVTSITFRSPVHGLYSIVPLACGLMLNFVCMSVFRIPLDMTTIMVANITIGVGIDNAIYLIIRYRGDLRGNGVSFGEAIGHTLEVMGRAAVMSTISVGMALLVFTTSAFKPIVYFGLLVIVSLSATTAATLTVLPALLAVDHRIRSRRGRRPAVMEQDGSAA
ncbi:MAG: MMPL family transporter [Spirochaetales bacterium]|nr:MMPL family transporter [Spirochaetales bacterium]